MVGNFVILIFTNKITKIVFDYKILLVCSMFSLIFDIDKFVYKLVKKLTRKVEHTFIYELIQTHLFFIA